MEWIIGATVYRDRSSRMHLSLQFPTRLLSPPVRAVQRSANALKRIARQGLESVLGRLMRPILARTGLATRINLYLLRFPRLHGVLRRTAQRAALLPAPEEPSPTATSIARAPFQDPSALSPRAQRIHADLQQVFARRQGSRR